MFAEKKEQRASILNKNTVDDNCSDLREFSYKIISHCVHLIRNIYEKSSFLTSILNFQFLIRLS